MGRWFIAAVSAFCTVSGLVAVVESQSPTSSASACSASCKPSACQASTGICYSCIGNIYVHRPSGQCGDTTCPMGLGSVLTYVSDTMFYGLVCGVAGPPPLATVSNTATGPTTPASPLPTSTAQPSSGLSAAILGVIIGVSVGVLIIAGGIFFVVYYFRSRRELALAETATHVNMRELRQAPSNSNLQRPAARGSAQAKLGGIHEEESSTSTPAGATTTDGAAQAVDTAPLTPRKQKPRPVELTDEQREEFFGKLDEIRPNAKVLLEILNATNKVRRGTDDKEEAQRMKLAMDDMATVLRLVHRKANKIVIPPNGLQLAIWSAGLVASYQKSQSQTEETEGV